MRHKGILALGGAALLAGGALIAAQSMPDPAGAQSPNEAQASSAEAEAARREIANDPVAPKHAPQGYDATIIFYTDYQCPYCRKIHATLEQLAEEDGKVRIVYRDWPIFGAPSVEAAKAAIASQWQGKHAEFNDALMQIEGKLDSAKIRAAADRAGVDWARLQSDLKARKSDIDGLLDRTRLQAAMMRLQGTPALLVGPYLIPGAVDYSTLTSAVRLAREFEQGKASPQS